MTEPGTMAGVSRATHVTFYEDRARVVRVASATIEAGVGRVRVGGVSPFVDERGVQAAILSGDATVLSASVHWYARPEGTATPKDVEALEARRLDAERAVALAEGALGRTTESRTRIAAIVADEAMALGHVPAGMRDAGVTSAHTTAWATLGTAESEARATTDRLRRELAALRDALELAEARVGEARTQEPRLEAAIDVQLDAAHGGDVAIELAYIVPCALWRPEHLARLVTDRPDATRASLELVTLGTMWQRTGETWEEVEVALSTARPARDADPPLLVDDVLRTQRKAPEERRRVVVQSREETVKTAGLDRGLRKEPEMPGVDDGGEPLHYTASSRVTLRSDGRPARVEIARTSLDADVSRVVLAEVASAAHVRATATLSSGGPILAGPLRVARNATLVGRSRIDFVGKGEPFEVGFGADDAIRVRRRTHEERDASTLTGSQKVRRHVALYFSNLSDTRRSFDVIERLPVSEIEGLEVELLDAEGAPARAWKLDPKTGFATTRMTLDGRANGVQRLVYELRAASNVVLES